MQFYFYPTIAVTHNATISKLFVTSDAHDLVSLDFAFYTSIRTSRCVALSIKVLVKELVKGTQI